MGFISCRQIPHWQEVLKGVPKVIPPPFCPASQCQLGFGCGESPWQCPRRRPCLVMPVESRSAGTPSHCLSALELQLVTSPVPIGKRGSKEGKPICCELQSGAEELSRSIPGAPRTADLSCWLQEAHGGCPRLSRPAQWTPMCWDVPGQEAQEASWGRHTCGTGTHGQLCQWQGGSL